jgi:hypothetical protein
MERDEDGVVLGSTRLSGSQRLHRKDDATREAGGLVGPMTAADSPSAISVFRVNVAKEIKISKNYTIPVFVRYSFNEYGVQKFDSANNLKKIERHFFSAGMTFTIR